MPYLNRLCQALLLAAMMPIVALAGIADTKPQPTPTTMHDKTATPTTTKPLPQPTTTTTRPTPTTQPTTPCAPHIVQIIEDTWPTDTAWAIQIAWRESNCTPDVSNTEGALGLFQLLGHPKKIADAGGDWADPATNARAARALYEQCGRLPWTPPNYGCETP